MNVIDVVAIAVCLALAVSGLRSGLIVQALGFLGAAAGIGVIVALGPTLAEAIQHADPLLQPFAVMAALVIAIGIGQLIAGRIARSLRPRRPGILRSLDAGAGGLLGLAEGLLLVWLVGGLLVATGIPRVSVEARRSAVIRELDARLPSPVGVMVELARGLAQAGLPETFVGLGPPAALPVDGPAQDEADAIAANARASVLRVEAAACLRLQSGTAFAVAPRLFVTNAHVVAGAEEVEVSLEGRSDRFDAEVVLFDPSLDLAALTVDSGVPALTPLALAAEAPDAGAQAAAIGHTGGGSLRAIPAAVRRTIPAIGRDIYGADPVRREIVELQAAVAPGDSGGPLVLRDGSVGGMIFSESRADPDVGYALSPDAISLAVGPVLHDEAAAAVATGPCTSG